MVSVEAVLRFYAAAAVLGISATVLLAQWFLCYWLDDVGLSCGLHQQPLDPSSAVSFHHDLIRRCWPWLYWVGPHVVLLSGSTYLGLYYFGFGESEVLGRGGEGSGVGCVPSHCPLTHEHESYSFHPDSSRSSVHRKASFSD